MVRFTEKFINITELMLLIENKVKSRWLLVSINFLPVTFVGAFEYGELHPFF